jgi:predicted O-linked N-acetylglucosamine transferase (SPINDLY family)
MVSSHKRTIRLTNLGDDGAMEQRAARFVDAVGKIETSSLDVVSLITTVDALRSEGEADLGQVLYKFWLLANTNHPLRHIIAFNCGSQQLQLGNIELAKTHLRDALASNPDFYQARLNLASAFEREGDVDGAVAEWRLMVDRLSSLNQSNISLKIQALKNIARVQKSAEVGESVLKQAIEIDSTQPELIQHWINRRQGRCVWPLLEPVGVVPVREVLEKTAPLSISAFVDDPELHLLVARNYSRQLAGRMDGYSVLGDWSTPESVDAENKIRIGYVSSDFCHHAVGYLMSDVFENHDRSRFEITVFNIGQRNDDAIQQRIMGKVDHWVDIRGIPDREAAKLIIERRIDILLDMNGHTNYQRTGLLAMKPAPIIANWLGYPGTMGSSYHHYIIADEFIIPERLEPYYSEKVLRLPCYQPNGKLYPVPVVQGGRAEFGLPETGVVFACFNGSVKITEPVFHRWCIILASVPGSVIWLRGSEDQDFAVRLRAEAARRGIAPERLVFLPFRSNTEYLGCHRHADLFLDTFPYGAHTTASDALRMGVPIVTLAGMSFASRVCGSLSRAAGLTDLICETPDQYVVRAVELGNNPARLQEIKARLAASLPGCDLFNAPLLVRKLEELFDVMWSDYVGGTLHQPDLSHVNADRCIPPDVSRISSEYIPVAEYERRLRLAQVG